MNKMKINENTDAIDLTISDLNINPGFVDTIVDSDTSGIPLTDHSICIEHPINDFSRFTLDTNMEWSEATLDILTGREDYDNLVQFGLLERIKNKIRGYQFIHEEIEHRYIPLVEVHRPDVSGCTATMKFDKVKDNSKIFNVKIIGFGGGPTTTFKCGMSNVIESESSCVRLYLPVKISHKVFIDHNEGRKPFVRSGVIEILPGHKLVDLKGDEDICCRGLSNKPYLPRLYNKTVVFDYSETSQNGSKTYFMETGDKISLGMEFSLDVPVISKTFDVNLSQEISTSDKIQVEYYFVGKQKYIGYDLKDTFGLVWDW